MNNISAFPRQTMLEYHLRHNHYPPMPASFLLLAQTAIEHARDGDYDSEIPLPAGFRYRGNSAIAVREIVEELHLRRFLDDEQDCGADAD